ncbi:uncharacterized protein TNIN_442991 [Trichonephila inaurata madagascariensis]|uniref:Uncharacterized protein n=1 Tax=Trichonephila inaurata madagascariensis TaxID=2747483 RepID=A0A8X7C1T6_9ARAC|nr:uncharacterized protein TNIN_442991 [Trichonephila inaurata madagascariensis]
MNVKINVQYDAIRALNSETSRKPIRISEKDLPKTIREQNKIKKHIRKEWRKFRNPFRRKLLKMAHTKYNELIAAHKPGSCHKFIAFSLSEEKLSKEAEKGYKITNCRMVPLIGSNEPLITYAKKSQELINEYPKHRSILTEADFAKRRSPLYSFPKMHPCKQSILPKCASNNKSQKELDRNVKNEKDSCLLLQDSRTNTLQEHNAEENLTLCTPYSEGEEKINSVISFELCGLFIEALKNLIGEKEFHLNVAQVLHDFDLLRTVMDPWCHFNDTYDKDLKDTLCYRIAYIYRNSTCISSAVAQHFLKTMNQHSNIMKRLLQKKELRIVSIGNGAPSDVIGIIKVLEHTTANFQGDLDIHVSTIGMEKKWKKTCITVLQCLERLKDRTMKIDFIPADASDLFSDKIKCAIRSADIVSMVKHFSDLEEYNYSPEFMTSLFQTVLELVQIGALVFVLDYSEIPFMKACGGYSGSVPGCNLLYETLRDLYTLDKTVVEHWLQFRNSIHGFGADMFNIFLDTFSRVWL